MKAVIVEIKDGFAAVLSEDGCIEKIKDNSYRIGQVIEMKEQKKVRIPKKLAVCAAAVAVFLVTGSVGAWAYNTPYSYVSLDVNPSIEYSVNRFDVVIDVTAVNDDGEAIINEINVNNLNNQPIEKAIEQTVSQIAENGYFEPTTIDATQVGTQTDVNVVSGGGIVISTSSEDPDKADELADELQQTVEDQVSENGDVVEVEVISVGLERVQEARELGVTPGKLNLVEKLKASVADPDSIVLEEWLNKPVKEIMKATKENRKAAKAGETITEETQEVVEAVNGEDTTAITDEAKSAKKDTKVAEKATKEQTKAVEKTAKEQTKAVEKTAKEQTKAIEKTAKVTDKATNTQTKVEEKVTKKEEQSSKVEKKIENKEEVDTEKSTKKENSTKEKDVKENQKNTNSDKVVNVGDSKTTDSSDKSGDNSAKETNGNNDNGNSSNNGNGKSNK